MPTRSMSMSRHIGTSLDDVSHPPNRSPSRFVVEAKPEPAAPDKGDDGDINDHKEAETGPGGKKVFIKSHGLTSVEANELLKIWGRNELQEKVIPKWYIFCSQLWQVIFYALTLFSVISFEILPFRLSSPCLS